MSRIVLTEAKCLALKPDAKRRRFIPDALCPGLVLSITTTGHRSFMLRGIWPGGANRVRRLLGEVGVVSLDLARNTAREWIALLAEGRDPQLELDERKRRVVAEQALTFAVVANDYIVQRLRGRRQGARSAREIRTELVSRWGQRPITAITKGDVIQLVDDLKARARRNVGARSTGAYGRIIFNHARVIFQHAALRHDLERLPTDRLKPAQLGLTFKPRERVLSDDEIRALWRACDVLGYPFGSYVKVLLMTGVRRCEASAAVWPEFNLEAKLWTIPRERAKSDAEHVVPITAALAELLATLPRYRSGDHLFSTTFGRTSIRGFSKYGARLLRLMRAELGEAMPNLSLHDLRRTYRSKLSELGIAENVAERCIGHGPRNALVRIYDRHGYEVEIRDANERWHRRLRELINPPTANIVALVRTA